MTTLIKNTQLRNDYSLIMKGFLNHGIGIGGLNQYTGKDQNAIRGAMLFNQPLVNVSTRSNRRRAWNLLMYGVANLCDPWSGSDWG